MAYITVLHVCVKAISASFLCQPYIYYTLKFKVFFHLLVSSLFVLNDVIIEDTVGLCTCTCVFVVVCMKNCLPTKL